MVVVVVVLNLVTSAPSSELSSGVSGSEWCVYLALARSAAVLVQALDSLLVEASWLRCTAECEPGRRYDDDEDWAEAKKEEAMPSSLMTRLLRPPELREMVRFESNASADHVDEETISGLLAVVFTPGRLDGVVASRSPLGNAKRFWCGLC